MDKRGAFGLQDVGVPVRFRLFGLWCSLLFFYIYGDYFELYQPGKLREMVAGSTVFGGVSQGVLLGTSAVMIVPALMPVLSLVLPAGVSRWVNVVAGALYTVVMLLAIRGGWHFYVLYGLIEIALTALIVWYAWTWPRVSAG